jgi:hypothetical protein
MNHKTKELRVLMECMEMSCEDVAKLTGREAQTVRIWRSTDDRRCVPDAVLDQLRSAAEAYDSQCAALASGE